MNAFEELGSPYLETSGELIDLASDIYMSESVVKVIRNARTTGLNQYTEFQIQRILSR